MTTTHDSFTLVASADPVLTLADSGLRLMADSTTPRNIPSDFNAPDRLVAPYIDGAFKWPVAQLRRFSKAVQVTITVTGDPAAMVADVESGDLTPEGFAAWLKARLDAGQRWHGLYSSIDSRPLVDQAVTAAGLDPKLFGWWGADPTGHPHLVPGSVATQYLWGTGYDLSVVTPGWHPAS